MSAVRSRAYRSPTLVLLAMDWDGGASRPDFLGFAISRSPGFQDLETGVLAPESWLPNRLSFSGPPARGAEDFPSNRAPIQKFLWWDARLEGISPGQKLTYAVTPVCGRPDPAGPDGGLTLLGAEAAVVETSLPAHEELGIGTWFNRAVMSSQAFSRKLRALKLAPDQEPSEEQALQLRSWLANGMEAPIPAFILDGRSDSLVGAIYHLTDQRWIIPALSEAAPLKEIGLVYDAKDVRGSNGVVKPTPNAEVVGELGDVIHFSPRTKTSIMHDKFLVAGKALHDKSAPAPARVTCGSANYTTEGLTSQANLVHTFESRELAEAYLARYRLLKPNPTVGETAKGADWSPTFSIGDCGVRVFFSPEKGKRGDPSRSIETIIQAIHRARSSVIFCLFMPTDERLRQACFSAGDAGKMMFGLVNRVASSEPTTKPGPSGAIPADQLAELEIYHRSREHKDTVGANRFDAAHLPPGFELEVNVFPGESAPRYPPVLIHHKFIVIDGETDSPVIYSGSANMSGNSVFGNDENLLEITGSPRLGQIYLAEFLRLYEHYRARARFAPDPAGLAKPPPSLAKDRSWAAAHFRPGTPQYKARLQMLGEL